MWGNMSKKVAFLLVFSAVFCGEMVSAQRYFTTLEAGISMGGSQYFGDLNDHYGFKTINPAGGIYARQRLNSYIAIKASAYYTQVGYDDKYNSDAFEKERNLNFKSDIAELSVQAEFNFFAFITGDKLHRFTPYLTGGIGAFYYNPYTTYQGEKVYLRPLGTEGQNAGQGGRKYSDLSPCFPIGAGVKWWLKGGVNLSFEIADRLTTTDYLDDVSSTYVGINSFPPGSVAAALQDRSTENGNSATALGRPGKQRGNTSSYDQYLMAVVSISFNFTSYKCPSADRFDDELRVH
jgi:hypothetical protein